MTSNEMSGFQDQGYEAWKKSLSESDVTAEQYAMKIREKILESPEMQDKESRSLFIDVFDYVQKLVKQNKPLKVNLLKIYLEDLKGHKLEETSIISTLLLVSMCGFQLNEMK